MSDYSRPHHADGPPRHFWRRSLAFIIDIIVFYVAIFAVIFVITLLSPWNIGLGVLTYTECQPAPPSQLTAQVDKEWPLDYGLVRNNILCRKTYLYDKTSYVFRSETAKPKGLYTWSKWFVIATDENGSALASSDVVSMLLTQGLVTQLPALVAMGLFVYLSAWGRRTPGKRLMGLRIMTVDGIPPALHRTARRELLKFAPLILFAIANLLLTLRTFLQSDYISAMIAQSREMTATNLPLAIAVPIILGIAQLIWWLLPFLAWRGQTYYDRITDCTVRRAQEPVAGSRPAVA